MGIRGIRGMREVRHANHSDEEQIFELYKNEGWQSFSKSKIVELLKTSSYLVITEDEKIVAFARYLTDGIMTTFLAEILVLPTFRGQGLGRMLIEEIRNRAHGTRLELISEADDFYEHLGFRKVGTGYRKT